MEKCAQQMLQLSVLVCELALGNLEITSTRFTWLAVVMMAGQCGELVSVTACCIDRCGVAIHTHQVVSETNQQTNKPTHQHTNTPTHQHTNTPTHQHTNTPTHQHTNTQHTTHNTQQPTINNQHTTHNTTTQQHNNTQHNNTTTTATTATTATTTTYGSLSGTGTDQHYVPLD